MTDKVEKVHRITTSKVDPVRVQNPSKWIHAVKTRHNKGRKVDHEKWQQHSSTVIPES